MTTRTRVAPSGNKFFSDFQSTIEGDWLAGVLDDLVQRAKSAADDDVDTWRDLYREMEEIDAHVDTHICESYLAFQLNSESQDVSDEFKRINREIVPVATDRLIEFMRLLYATSAVKELAKEYGTVFLARLRSVCESNDPVNTVIHTEINEILMEHTEIYAKGRIEWRGEKHPLSYIFKVAVDPNRDERMSAFTSYVQYVQDNAEALESVFDRTRELRNRSAKNLGYDSYTDLRYVEMRRLDYDKNDVARFRSSIREHIVPLAAQLRAQQAESLGVALVHPADFDLDGESPVELAVAIDAELDVASRVLHKLDRDLGNLFDQTVSDNRVDLVAREGKTTGAFCMSLPEERVPYVFCNSVGAPDDIRTLVHEFGHAFQSYYSAPIEPAMLRSPTMEACEIHSMSLELLVLPHVNEFFGDDTERFCHEHVAETVLRVPYMASVDEFQHALYADDLPDAAARADLWAKLTDEYVPGVDHDAVPWWKGHRWLAQRHIFHSPFYYIDYALARVASWQLWLDSLEDPAGTLERYRELCRIGGTMTLRDTFAAGGIGDPFNPEVVADVAQRMRPHLGL